MKKRNGVSLISLIVTIIIMLIIASMLIYYTQNSIKVGKLNKIKADIENLNLSVSLYYLKNNKLPLKMKDDVEVRLDTNLVKELLKEDRNEEDGDEYYIVNPEYLENTTLNNVGEKEIFIINEKTHHVYYLSCQEGNRGEHVFIISQISGATCTEEGILKKECLCGETTTEVAPPLGHDFQGQTCVLEGVCSRCKAITPALGHDFAEGFNTYDEQNHWKKCSRCDAMAEITKHRKTWITTDSTSHWQICSDCRWEGNKLGHTNTETMIKNPTCIQEGNKQVSCNTCSRSSIESVAPLGHNYDNSYSGYDETNHWKKCSRCDATTGVTAHHKTWTSDNTNHWQICSECSFTGTKVLHTKSWVTDTENHAQTCNVCKWTEVKTPHTKVWKNDATNHWYVCNTCGWNGNTSPHQFTYSNVTATCTAAGNKTGTCTCGKTVIESSPALGHDFSTVFNGYDGTNHWKKCSRCTATTGSTAHTMTWTSDGSYHWQVCSSCGWTGSKISHSYSYVTNSTPTCSTPGSRIGTCSTCSKTVVESIPTVWHVSEGYWRSDDNYHWQECRWCSYKTYSQTSHTFSWTTITSATCTTAGTRQGTCSVCSKVKTETIYGGHPGTESQWRSDGTYHWRECTSCSYKMVGPYTHSGGTATCTSQATCSTCNAVYGGVGTHVASSSWSSNSSGHWKACISCGTTVVSSVAHSSTTSWTNSGESYSSGYHYKYCTVCSYQTSTANHTDTYGNWVQVDNRHHQVTCKGCGAKSNLRAHNKSGEHCGTCGARNVTYNCSCGSCL